MRGAPSWRRRHTEGASRRRPRAALDGRDAGQPDLVAVAAICCIEWGGGTTLRLVDLAGSERNYETLQMSSRAFLRESAEINKGLMALKDYFRVSTKRAAAAADGAAAGGGAAAARVPYRASMLTRVLRGYFEDGDHHTAVVAAVAPGASSVPHTLNSLEHVLLMNPSLSSHSIEAEFR